MKISGHEYTPAPPVERLRPNLPLLLLAAALLLGVAMTLVLTAGFTFYQDSWAFLINRRDLSPDALFEPHNDHLVVFAALIEWLLIHVFGMTSALPEYVLLALVLAATAALLFIYIRKRVGPWPALFAAVIVLTLGPAWEVLLWPFEITFLGPIFCGLAMLLVLEREDRRGDLTACILLTLAIGFSAEGIGFIAAAAVAVLIGPRQRWRGRAYIVIVPLALYAVWWLGWGHEAESHLSIHNLAESPVFVIESLAWSLQAMLGLSPAVGAPYDFNWGKALLVGFVIFLGYRYWRYRPPLDRWLWPAIAVAVATWFLTALNAFPGRDPAASRYQYAGVVFVMLILANLFKGTRLGRTAVIVLGVLTVLVVGPNMVILKQGRDLLKRQSVLTRADTAAIEIASRTVDTQFQLHEPAAGTVSLGNIYAGEYLQAIDDFGSPAYSEEELENAPAEGRKQADIVLAHALPLSTKVRRGSYRLGVHGDCVTVPGGGKAVPEVVISSGVTKIKVAGGPRANFSLRRFATNEYPVALEGAPGDSEVLLRVPRDTSSRPWRLHVEAKQTALICRD